MSLPSPNHGDRRGANAPDLVVIHYTGMADTSAARARLCDPAAEVSAHWLVHEDGRTEALVPENRRAWHAGAGAWQGRADVNSHSIGIELANPGDRPFSHPQMSALEELLAGIMARWSIAPQRVIGHSDMAPGRKIDPGPRFDWDRLARLGLALGPIRPRDTVEPLPVLLDALGYPQAEPDDRLAAFRLRFCPWHRGPETAGDSNIAAAALATLRAAPHSPLTIYKVLRAPEWEALERDGETPGAPVDLADGFVHLSTAPQLAETLARHFSGEDGLQLLALEAAPLGTDLRWEPSRDGALFPHLYRPLRMADIAWQRPLPLGPDGHDLGYIA